MENETRSISKMILDVGMKVNASQVKWSELLEKENITHDETKELQLTTLLHDEIESRFGTANILLCFNKIHSDFDEALSKFRELEKMLDNGE